MAKAIFKVLFKVMKKIMDLLMFPINAGIMALMPDLAGAIGRVGSFFHYLEDYVPLVCSYIGISTEVWSIISALSLTGFMISITFHGLKIVLKWYSALVP